VLLFAAALLGVAVLATSEDPPQPAAATAVAAVEASASAVNRRDRVLMREPPGSDVTATKR